MFFKNNNEAKMTYLIDIDNAKTTAMLKGILKHEGLDEALANIFFKNIECSEALDLSLIHI